MNRFLRIVGIISLYVHINVLALYGGYYIVQKNCEINEASQNYTEIVADVIISKKKSVKNKKYAYLEVKSEIYLDVGYSPCEILKKKGMKCIVDKKYTCNVRYYGHMCKVDYNCKEIK